MNSDEFPLLDFFTALQKAGLPLGINDYKLLLQAFQGGFGTDTEALKRVCKGLWIKSDDEERLFNYHFSLAEPELRRKQEKAKESELLKSDIKAQTKTSEPEITLQEKPSQELPEQRLPETGQPETPDADPAVSPEFMKHNDEVELSKIVTSIQIGQQYDKEIPLIHDRFILTGDYFPITRRQMKQTWRYLRCFVREGNRKELDVEATVNKIGQQGFLLEPVMIPCRINRVELLLLIDQKGSMVPFHAISQRLKQTAVRGGHLGKADVYYFHNVPTEWLYKDTALVEADKTDDVLARVHPSYTNVLIISDAGAARGGYSLERSKLTESFLDKLKSYVSHMVWLNPMPRFRWLGTTADEIEQHIPMFEMSRQGLDNAIGALRRQP